VSYLSDLATDNQRADAPRFLVLSLFCLCFFSALPRVSISSLSLDSFSFFALEISSFLKFSNACLFLFFFAQLLGFDRFSVRAYTREFEHFSTIRHRHYAKSEFCVICGRLSFTRKSIEKEVKLK
jgi:hypothetical protein